MLIVEQLKPVAGYQRAVASCGTAATAVSRPHPLFGLSREDPIVRKAAPSLDVQPSENVEHRLPTGLMEGAIGIP